MLTIWGGGLLAQPHGLDGLDLAQVLAGVYQEVSVEDKMRELAGFIRIDIVWRLLEMPGLRSGLLVLFPP